MRINRDGDLLLTTEKTETVKTWPITDKSNPDRVTPPSPATLDHCNNLLTLSDARSLHKYFDREGAGDLPGLVESPVRKRASTRLQPKVLLLLLLNLALL
jgi:hypothetical protein